MRAAIVHLTLNALGGAERLCLDTLEALKLAGHEVSLITLEKTDWTLVEKGLGRFVKPDREIYSTLGALQERISNEANALLVFAAYFFRLLSLQSSKKYDLIINTYGDLINSIADLTYVHFPIRATIEYSQFPPMTGITKWNIYCKIYGMLSHLIDQVNGGIILTNSKFMRGVIRKFIHQDALVVYPPVDVEAFSQIKNRQKHNIVVTVSGYSPKRHLEAVPFIAKRVKQGKFVIVGRTNPYSHSTLHKLRKIIKTLNIEEKVKLLTDIPRPKLKKILSKAKIYLHVMPNEHFGTSIVEAMASKCVPVVHRSGGPWLDILDQRQGEYGYSFSSVQEAAEYIEEILLNENLRKEIASAAFKRSMLFSKPLFMKRITKIAEEVYASKLAEGA